jgi:hypothetical protein
MSYILICTSIILIKTHTSGNKVYVSQILDFEWNWGWIYFRLIRPPTPYTRECTPEDGLIRQKLYIQFFQSLVFVKRIPCVLNFISLIENVLPRTITIVFQCNHTI